MAQGFLAACFLHLLVLFAIGASVAILTEGLCSEDLSTCDANCKTNCNAKHPDGEGSCYTNLAGINVCRCYYQCSHKCLTGLGSCLQCDKNCCAAKCADQYPGGQGFCDDIAGTSLCQCQHDCPPTSSKLIKV